MLIPLAIEHLNSGNGIIVPEVDGLNNRCNIRFSAEFFDGEGFGSQLIVKDLLDILGREVGGDKPLPCAFAGGILSGPSVSTSTITGLTGYPQSENVLWF